MSTDNWDHIQYQAFLDWVNHFLAKRDIEVFDLTMSFSDGVNWINLVECVSEMSVGRYSRNPKHTGQKLDNIKVAINFMEHNWKLKILGCNPKDIMDGNRKQCMGLLFLLITTYKKQGMHQDLSPSVPTKALSKRIGTIEEEPELDDSLKKLSTINENEMVESTTSSQDPSTSTVEEIKIITPEENVKSITSTETIIIEPLDTSIETKDHSRNESSETSDEYMIETLNPKKKKTNVKSKKKK